MEHTLEYVRLSVALDEMVRPVLEGARLSLEQKQAAYHVAQKREMCAQKLADVDFSSAPDSDYRILLRNERFMEEIAIVSAAASRVQAALEGKSQNDIESYHETRGSTAFSEESIKTAAKLKSGGLEQVSEDHYLREALKKQDPQLLSQVDRSVQLSARNPYYNQLSRKQKVRLYLELFKENPNALGDLDLKTRFLLRVAPNTVAETLANRRDARIKQEATTLGRRLEDRSLRS